MTRSLTIAGRRADVESLPTPGKLCSRCRQRLPVDQFARSHAAIDGLQAWCKPCKLEWAQHDTGDGHSRGEFRPPVPLVVAFELVCMTCGRTSIERWTPRRGQLEQIASRLRCSNCSGFILISEDTA